MASLILSLDVPHPAEAVTTAAQCGDGVRIVKIGPALFLPGGNAVVRDIQGMGKEIFLDLKFHDIPNTVSHAIRRSMDMGVMMLTLHTTGGADMMKAAVQESRAYAGATGRRRPLLVGVTVLTSMDQDGVRRDFGVEKPIGEIVVSLASLARAAGLDGVVCSPLEISSIKKECGREFLTVVPGIRAPGAPAGTDQKRTMSASDAVREGADYLVVGRPILEAPDKRAAIAGLEKEIADASSVRR